MRIICVPASPAGTLSSECLSHHNLVSLSTRQSEVRSAGWGQPQHGPTACLPAHLHLPAQPLPGASLAGLMCTYLVHAMSMCIDAVS